MISASFKDEDDSAENEVVCLLSKTNQGGTKNTDTSVQITDTAQYDHSLPESSWIRIVCLTGYNFPYGAIMGSFGLFVLPQEAAMFVKGNSTLRVWLLAVFIFVVGVAQLVCPLAGRYSDTHASSLGKRRPLLIAGTLGVIISSFMLYIFAKVWKSWELYAFFLFIAMISINSAWSAQAGLVPDLLPTSQHGIASGMAAVHALAGSCFGFLWIMLYPGQHYSIYFVIPATFFVFSYAACLAGVEKRLTPEDLPPWKLKDVLDCFKMDTKSDFFIVFLGRTAYYVAVAVQNFILYYLRDLILVGTYQDPEQQYLAAKRAVSTIALMGQVCGAIVAYPAAHITHTQQGRKRIIYLANLIMAMVYISFLVIPYLQIDIASKLRILAGTGGFYGLGNGAFLSVDLALALETLPCKIKATQNLGIWGLSAFLGSVLGVTFWSLLLYVTACHKCDPSGGASYTQFGYTLMIAGGCISNLLSALFISKVKRSNYDIELDNILYPEQIQPHDHAQRMQQKQQMQRPQKR